MGAFLQPGVGGLVEYIEYTTLFYIIVSNLQPLLNFRCGFSFWGIKLRRFVLFFILFIPYGAWADLASTTYVETRTTTKVDVSETANQTMAGTYTVSGTFVVPTPALPSAE